MLVLITILVACFFQSGEKTFLVGSFFVAIIFFDTRNIRDIIPKASRKHPEGWRLFIVADFMWQLLPSSSQ
ncbi:MAG: hypothetical protein SPJ25_07165, partial [Prevotella sp.]|nr:hypothetical protein [Prevotella sp.]